MLWQLSKLLNVMTAFKAFEFNDSCQSCSMFRQLSNMLKHCNDSCQICWMFWQLSKLLLIFGQYANSWKLKVMPTMPAVVAVELLKVRPAAAVAAAVTAKMFLCRRWLVQDGWDHDGEVWGARPLPCQQECHGTLWWWSDDRYQYPLIGTTVPVPSYKYQYPLIGI